MERDGRGWEDTPPDYCIDEDPVFAPGELLDLGGKRQAVIIPHHAVAVLKRAKSADPEKFPQVAVFLLPEVDDQPRFGMPITEKTMRTVLAAMERMERMDG